MSRTSEPQPDGTLPEAKPLWMNAYYYGFTPTGVRAIDVILSAVAAAGKAYHHTESWLDDAEAYPPFRGDSYAAFIQNAATDAAKELRAAYAAGQARWQDIATAPKDGTDVIMLTSEGADVGCWHDGYGPSIDDPGLDPGWMGIRFATPGVTQVRKESCYYREAFAQPTHWMPFPAPPEAEGGARPEREEPR